MEQTGGEGRSDVTDRRRGVMLQTGGDRSIKEDRGVVTWEVAFRNF